MIIKDIYVFSSHFQKKLLKTLTNGDMTDGFGNHEPEFLKKAVLPPGTGMKKKSKRISPAKKRKRSMASASTSLDSNGERPSSSEDSDERRKRKKSNGKFLYSFSMHLPYVTSGCFL